MLNKLNASLNVHEQALHVRGLRQEIIASNIANADTPAYRARDIDFKATLDRAMANKPIRSSSLSLSQTSAAHIPGKALFPSDVGIDLLYRQPIQPSADGNTVDMDRERINFAENSFKYQASLTFLSNRIKSLQSVIQNQ